MDSCTTLINGLFLDNIQNFTGFWCAGAENVVHGKQQCIKYANNVNCEQHQSSSLGPGEDDLSIRDSGQKAKE
jgi:hypothetical protein